MTCPFAYNPDLEENNCPHNDKDVLDYDSYLQLDKILTSNERQSTKGGKKGAHTEHLFITIHQVSFSFLSKNNKTLFVCLVFRAVVQTNDTRDSSRHSYLSRRNCER